MYSIQTGPAPMSAPVAIERKTIIVRSLFPNQSTCFHLFILYLHFSTEQCKTFSLAHANKSLSFTKSTCFHLFIFIFCISCLYNVKPSLLHMQAKVVAFLNQRQRQSFIISIKKPNDAKQATITKNE